MHHVAIMNPKTCPAEGVISGRKTIESRWYKTRRAPFRAVQPNDVIYFKESGKPVTAMAVVSRVIEIEDLTSKKIQEVIKYYGDKMDIKDKKSFLEKIKDTRYCILIFLRKPKHIKPFHISKKGFGSAAAWLVVENIKIIKI